MVSLIDLPLHALEIVFSQATQHQALAVAVLHSKLNLAIKPRLYKFIHVYDIKLKNSQQKHQALKLHHDVHNYMTRKYTLISLTNFRRCLQQMDGNQPIYELEMFACDQKLCLEILHHLTKIKHFIIVDCLRLDTNYSRQLDSSCELHQYCSPGHCIHENTNLLRSIGSGYGEGCIGYYSELRFAKSVYKPKITTYSADRLKATIQKIGQVSNCKQLELDIRGHMTPKTLGKEKIKGYHCDLQLEKLIISRLGMRCGFKINQLFLTRYIVSLTVIKEFEFGLLVAPSRFEYYFPNLKELVYDSGYGDILHDQLDTILSMRHRRLEHFIILTQYATLEIAEKLAQMYSNYRNVSINWWDREILVQTKDSKTDYASTLSKKLPSGMIGFHWRKNNFESGRQHKRPTFVPSRFKYTVVYNRKLLDVKLHTSYKAKEYNIMRGVRYKRPLL